MVSLKNIFKKYGITDAPSNNHKWIIPASLFDLNILEGWRQEAINKIDSLHRLFQRVGEDVLTHQKVLSQLKDTAVTELRKLQSYIDIYHMYAGIDESGTILLSDCFSDTTKIDPNSNANINTKEGIATLPIAGQKIVSLQKATINISPESIGEPQSDTSLLNIIDGSLDTYYSFQYRTTALAHNAQAKLVLFIELDEPTPINNISITGVNLGEWGNPIVENIELSPDNVFFKKLNIPDDAHLDPVFTYTFLPQIVKALKVTIKQPTSIYNHDNNSYEYNIGIYELQLKTIEFKDGARLIAQPLQVDKTPRLISLDTITNLSPDSDFITYAIRAGDKEYPITPMKDSSSKEILAINQPWLENSVDINDSLNSIQLIAYMQKDTKKVPSLIKQNDLVLDNSEYVDIPSAEPYTISLQKKPIPETLDIIMYPYASVGKGINIQVGQAHRSQNMYVVPLPFEIANSNNIVVKAGPYVLQKYDNLADLVDFASAGYYIDKNEQNVKIVIRHDPDKHNPEHYDHIDPKSNVHKTVRHNALIGADILDNEYMIELYLESEVLEIDKALQLHLSYPSDAIQENFQIERAIYNADGSPYYQTIIQYVPKGTTELVLTHVPKEGETITVPDSYEVDFIDGLTEFDANRGYAFSVDRENKKLYRSYPAEVDMSITYAADYRQPLSNDAFRVINAKTIAVSPYAVVAPNDKILKFIVSYNMAAILPRSSYTIDGDNITLTDKTVLDIFLNKIDFKDKLIKATYRYHSDIHMDQDTFAKMFTPIIRQYTLKVVE